MVSIILPDPPKSIMMRLAIQGVQIIAQKVLGRTYQDLQKNKFDEEKLHYYLNEDLIFLWNEIQVALFEHPQPDLFGVTK